MTNLIVSVILLCHASAAADTVILKDGTKLTGAFEGEMEGVAIFRTQYGVLNINKSDIAETVKDAPAAAPAAQAAEVSTAAPAAQAAEPPRPAPALTFSAVAPSTTTSLKIYSEDGVAVATETYDSKGALVSLEGSLRDGTWKEFYPDGKVKTEKTLAGGKENGELRAYYPSGALQSSAFYSAGRLDGQVKILGEDGKTLFEQNFKGGLPHGWFREYHPDGAVKSEQFYSEGRPAEPPKPAAAAKPAEAPQDSSVTAKYQSLARGERYSFHVNGKYSGKATLDKDNNLLSREGKLPDGLVKVYNREGKLYREFVFKGGELETLRVYAADGSVKSEFGYDKDGKALKK